MKMPKTKAEERREIEQQINFYLREGGSVDFIEPGVSGRTVGTYPLPAVSFNKVHETRTLLLDEVRAIEARKARPPSASVRRTVKKPRKVLIRDDFGEPLRWSWQE